MTPRPLVTLQQARLLERAAPSKTNGGQAVAPARTTKARAVRQLEFYGLVNIVAVDRGGTKPEYRYTVTRDGREAIE